MSVDACSIVPVVFSMLVMDQLDSPAVAAAILAAPLTTLLALTTRDPRLRERAAERLARAILSEPQYHHPDQLTLPIM